MTTAAIYATREASWRPSFYRGEQFDSDLGLYYLRARYYNPATGRFLSRDPEDGLPTDPASLHKYLYANGDPVNKIDPRGHGALDEDEDLEALDTAAMKRGLMISCVLHYVFIRAALQLAGLKGAVMDWSWVVPAACGAIGW
jgi:RHS repeat-associated protein